MNNKKNIVLILIAAILVLGGWLIFRDRTPVVETENTYENIIGSWQSVEYPALIREFNEDGTVTDSFGGGEVASGFWEMFTSKEAPEVSHVSFDDQSVYLRMTLTGEERDMIYFQVISATSETLELLYMGPGGVLEFERVADSAE